MTARGLTIDLTEQAARRALRFLILVEIALVLAGLLSIAVGDVVATIHALFDMDGESTVPAWFSSMQLFTIGLIFGIASLNQPPDTRPSRTFLRFCAAAFVFLSMDEAAIFHERLSWLLGNAIESLPRFRTGYGIWMYIYAPIAVLWLIWVRRDLSAAWQRLRRPSALVLAGFGVALLGAVALESFGYLFLRDDIEGVAYRIETVAEEFLEMLGMSIVLYGALLLALSIDSTATDERQTISE